jgi:uncharacterized membrane-anchored protein
MRKILFIVSSLFVFSVFNYAIWQKERIIATGDTVYLKLAPVDPRSLLQGDYMRLRYAIEREATVSDIVRGFLVVLPDANGVAQYRRVYDGTPLASDEKLFRFHPSSRSVRIVPDSFLFQEGHATRYEGAEYGIFKFAGPDKYVLVGLADESFVTLGEK